MSEHTIHPEGVCSSRIFLRLEEGVLRGVRFVDGCDGNAQGIARLLEGKPAAEAVRLLKGVKCSGAADPDTSCPDQLARGLQQFF